MLSSSILLEMSHESLILRKMSEPETQESVDQLLASALDRVDSADLTGTQKPPRTFDKEAKLVFLMCLSRCGLIGKSAAAAGVRYMTVKEHRRKDPLFDEAVEEALGYFRDRLESEALRRAINGVEVPLYYKGEQVGTRLEYSDRLLEKLMDRYIPEYRDANRVDVNLNTGVLVVTPPSSSPDEWAAQFNQEQSNG